MDFKTALESVKALGIGDYSPVTFLMWHCNEFITQQVSKSEHSIIDVDWLDFIEVRYKELADNPQAIAAQYDEFKQKHWASWDKAQAENWHGF